MEVVDGGQVVDLEPVFARRERGGDFGPVVGCELDLVGIRVVSGSDDADELREAWSRRLGGSLVAVAAADRCEGDGGQPDVKAPSD
jgi:hypothetical protein